MPLIEPPNPSKKSEESAWRLTLYGVAIVSVLFFFGYLNAWLYPSQSEAPAASITPIRAAGLQASSPLDSTEAHLEVNGRSYNFRSNANGLFPRISIPTRSLVKIHLHALPGEAVREQALDGGGLDNKTFYQEQLADENGSLDFHYQGTSSPGSSRVAILRNGKREIFDFWIDPTLAR